MDQLLDALTSIEKYKQGTKSFKEEAAKDPQTCELINEVVLQVLNKGKPLQKLLALKLVKEMAELNIQQFHRLLQDQILKIISDYAAFNKNDQFENLFMIPQEQAQLCHSIYRLSCDLIRVWAAWYPNSKFSKTYFNLLTDGVNFPDLKYYKKEQLYEVVDLNKEAKELVNQLNKDKINIWNDQIGLKSDDYFMLIEVQERLQQQLKQVDQALLNVSQSDQFGLIQDLLDKQDIIQKQLNQIKFQINGKQENCQKLKFNTTPNLEVKESNRHIGQRKHLNASSKINNHLNTLKLTQESDINDEYISEKNYKNEQSFNWQQLTIDFEQIQENNLNSQDQKFEAAQILIDELQMKYNQLQNNYSQLKEICFQKDIQILKLQQKLQELYTNKNGKNDHNVSYETNFEENSNKIYVQPSKLNNKYDDYLIVNQGKDSLLQVEKSKKVIKERLIQIDFKQISRQYKQQTSLCILNQQGLLFEKKQIKIWIKNQPNTCNITLYFFNNDNNFDQQVEIRMTQSQNIQIIQPKNMNKTIIINKKSSQKLDFNYKIIDNPFDQQILNIKLLNSNKEYAIILPISIYNFLQFEKLNSNQFKLQWNSDNSIRTPTFNYDQFILNDTTPITYYMKSLILLNSNKLEGYQIGLNDIKYGGAFTFQQCRYLVKFILTPDKQMIIKLNALEQKSKDLSEFILRSFQFLFY